MARARAGAHDRVRRRDPGRIAQDLAREVGDFVIRRADGWYAYQLAVVVDDAAQRITDVVRGADLIDSTPRQILLQDLLDLPRVRYAHLPLVLDGEGRKLSKHERALAVDAADPLPALRAALAFLGQRVRTGRTVASLLATALENFDARSIPAKAPAPAAICRAAEGRLINPRAQSPASGCRGHGSQPQEYEMT